jgi:hypothetical protein
MRYCNKLIHLPVELLREVGSFLESPEVRTLETTNRSLYRATEGVLHFEVDDDVNFQKDLTAQQLEKLVDQHPMLTTLDLSNCQALDVSWLKSLCRLHRMECLTVPDISRHLWSVANCLAG